MSHKFKAKLVFTSWNISTKHYITNFYILNLAVLHFLLHPQWARSLKDAFFRDAFIRKGTSLDTLEI